MEIIVIQFYQHFYRFVYMLIHQFIVLDMIVLNLFFQWNIADFLFQNKSTVVQSLEGVTLVADTSGDEDTSIDHDATVSIDMTSIDQFEVVKAHSLLGQFSATLPPFDTLWMLLFLNLTTLCVDDRPAVRKSASHTLFSTVMAHGPLLQLDTWPDVLWKVRILTNLSKLFISISIFCSLL